MPDRCLLPDGTTTRLPSVSASQSVPSRDSWVLRRCSPGRPGIQARDPPGDIPLVGDVLATEAALQERLLYQRHGERVEREENSQTRQARTRIRRGSLRPTGWTVPR